MMVAWARVIVVEREVNYEKGIITCSPLQIVLIEGLVCLNGSFKIGYSQDFAKGESLNLEDQDSSP